MMHRIITRLSTAAAVLLVAAPAALAHSGHDHGESSLLMGLMHPLGGLDHLLTMLAVGLVAGRMGGRALWLLPLSFASAVLVGAVFGFAGVSTITAEAVILLSVLVIGVLALMPLRVDVRVLSLLCCGFGLAHGMAHGAEAPAAGQSLYVLGFMLSTLALHALGLAFGLAMRKPAVRA
jgi:urease accessory protein